MNRRRRGPGICLSIEPMVLDRGGARVEVQDENGAHATWPVIDPFHATKLLYPSESAMQAAWVSRERLTRQWKDANGQ